MSYCSRCNGQMHNEMEYAEGCHGSCLTYDEKMKLEQRRRCKHKRTYTAKICKDCGKRVR